MTVQLFDIAYMGERDFAGFAPVVSDTAWVWMPVLEDVPVDEQDALEVNGGFRLVEVPLAEAFELLNACDVRACRCCGGFPCDFAISEAS